VDADDGVAHGLRSCIGDAAVDHHNRGPITALTSAYVQASVLECPP
jgi:hypothetical protein